MDGAPRVLSPPRSPEDEAERYVVRFLAAHPTGEATVSEMFGKPRLGNTQWEHDRARAVEAQRLVEMRHESPSRARTYRITEEGRRVARLLEPLVLTWRQELEKEDLQERILDRGEPVPEGLRRFAEDDAALDEYVRTGALPSFLPDEAVEWLRRLRRAFRP